MNNQKTFGLVINLEKGVYEEHVEFWNQYIGKIIGYQANCPRRKKFPEKNKKYYPLGFYPLELNLNYDVYEQGCELKQVLEERNKCIQRNVAYIRNIKK